MEIHLLWWVSVKKGMLFSATWLLNAMNDARVLFLHVDNAVTAKEVLDWRIFLSPFARLRII